jgi:arabinogalactan oligomer/maltooligosaccharide transport system permease protein
MKRAGLLALLAASTAFAEQTPLRLWHAYRGSEEQALLSATELFTKSTGVQVDLLAVPYDAFPSKLANAIPHGNGPDVFIFNYERLRLFHDEELIAPSDGQINAAAYVPQAVEALRLDDHVYGYPLSLKCIALYINRALLPANGGPAPGTPKTTDQWLAAIRALSSPGQNRYGLAYESQDFYYMAPFLFGFGGSLFDRSGRPLFDSPQMARALSFVKDLQDRQWMPSEVSGALVKALFNDGRAAMVIGGPWFAGEISPSIPYDVVRLPVVSETGRPMQPFLGVEAALVSARSQQMANAQALGRFLSVGPAALVRARVGRQIPAELAAYAQPDVKGDPLLSAFRDAAQIAQPMPSTLEMARVWEPMRLALHGVLQGTVAPEGAGALADRRYRALFRPRPPDASPVPYLIALGVVVLGFSAWKGRGLRSGQPLSRRYPEWRRALLYVAPAAAGVLVLVVAPLSVVAALSLYHHDGNHYSFVGMANFVDILASRGYRITEPLSFYFTLAVTLTWALVNVSLHVSIGLFLALLLKDPLVRLRGVFRVLLIVPWAVPNYITAMMWKGMFQRQFGAINGLLAWLGVEPVSWFTHFSTAFAANLATNTWLGFPFMMVVALGALQSIPQDLYEAAEVDGASRWVQFRRITLPLLRPALLPAVILGGIWSFNMFNIVYLVSGGEPGGATDILISEAYRWAFQRNEQYGFAGAYSVLIFLVLLGYSQLTKRASRHADELTA